MNDDDALHLRVVCRRRRHEVAKVAEEDGALWLDMRRALAHYGLGVEGLPDHRVRLRPGDFHRAGCPDCGRHGLLDHLRIARAIREYDDAGLPRGHRRRVMLF